MDALILLIQLLFRSIILLLPVAVAMLAFRRLALSESVNAWLYAGTALISCVTAAGLAPWAVGGANALWFFFVLAPLCPALWLGVVIICDLDRPTDYEQSRDATQHGPSNELVSLVLQNPKWPDAPTPVFRHASNSTNVSESFATFTSSRDTTGDSKSYRAQTVLEIARAMRGNVSSQHRRTPKRLPPPERMTPVDTVENLPFLRHFPQS